ncbi:unnamed protein product [Chrysoparadoxa australica]
MRLRLGGCLKRQRPRYAYSRRASSSTSDEHPFRYPNASVAARPEVCIKSGHDQEQLDDSIDRVKKFTQSMRQMRHSNQAQRCLALLKEAEESGLALDSKAYNAAIRAMGRNWRLAFTIPNMMKRRGVELDTYGYNALLHVCASDGAVREANKVFESMKAAGIEPDFFAYAALLQAVRTSGTWQEVADLFKQLRKDGMQPSVSIYNTLLGALKTGGQWKKALGVLREMEAASIKPDLITYGILISACAKSNKGHGNAVDLFVRMQMKGLQPNIHTYGALIDSCAQRGDWLTAVEMLAEMKAKDMRLNSYIYNSVINACAKGRRLERGLRLLSEMKAKGLAPTVLTYNTLLHGCSREDNLQVAQELLQEMNDHGILPDMISYSCLVSVAARADEVELAWEYLKTLKRMESIAPSRNRPYNKLLPYNSILWAYALAGNWARAEDTLREVNDAGLSPSRFSYGAVIKACIEGGEWEKGEEWLAKMKRDGVKPHIKSYHHLIDSCKDWMRAVELYNECLPLRIKGHWVRDKVRTKLDLHSHSVGAALAATLQVLRGLLPHEDTTDSFRHNSEEDLYIVTGHAMTRFGQEGSKIQPALFDMLHSLTPPLEAVLDPMNPGQVVIVSSQLKHWCLHQELLPPPASTSASASVPVARERATDEGVEEVATMEQEAAVLPIVDEIGDMKVRELIQWLRVLGLNVTGRKSVLQARLLGAVMQKKEAAARGGKP